MKANPIIKYHIHQIVYLGVLLYRIFDGENHSDFLSIFIQTYFSKNNEKLLIQKEGVSCLLMLTQINQEILNLSQSYPYLAPIIS